MRGRWTGGGRTVRAGGVAGYSAMTTSLFSIYSQRENRVTATFLAVLERLSLSNMDRILQALLEDRTFRLIRFQNQPSGIKSRPDGIIKTSSSIWIETKTSENVVDHDQISRHLKSLQDKQKLLLLTPDDFRPKSLHKDVAWSNFTTLTKSIQEILENKNDPASEKEAFLLRELLRMLENQGLLVSSEKRVLVFPAPSAWPMYQSLSVYRRSTGRSFRKSAYIGFYSDGEIKPSVPKLRAEIKSIDLRNQGEIDALDEERREYAARLKEKIDREGMWHEFGQAFHLMFLSNPDDEETVKLTNPVKNDKKGRGGKRTAFTQSFTYVNLDKLKVARTTGDLRDG